MAATLPRHAAPQPTRSRPLPWLVGLAAAALAAVTAKPHAGGWNDGSRLAAVESLADHHTLAIDDSVFSRPRAVNPEYPAYGHDGPDLNDTGTLDKLWIGGQFYSDKPAVVTVLMAGVYRGARLLGLPPAAERPDLFALVMTLAAGGAAYVISLVVLFGLARRVGLPDTTALILVAAVGLGTFALAYTWHVNNHVLLLGVAAGVASLVSAWAATAVRAVSAGGGSSPSARSRGWPTTSTSGPARCWSSACSCWSRPGGGGPARRRPTLSPFCRGYWPFTPSTTPSAGCSSRSTWSPVLQLAGVPVRPGNLTGFLRHGPWELFVYSLALLFGKHGFFSHNLPMVLALPAAWHVLRRPGPHRAGAAALAAWCRHHGTTTRSSPTTTAGPVARYGGSCRSWHRGST